MKQHSRYQTARHLLIFWTLFVAIGAVGGAIAGGCFELPLPEEEMQNFRQLVQPLYRKYCADYLPLVEEIQAE